MSHWHRSDLSSLWMGLEQIYWQNKTSAALNINTCTYWKRSIKMFKTLLKLTSNLTSDPDTYPGSKLNFNSNSEPNSNP